MRAMAMVQSTTTGTTARVASSHAARGRRSAASSARTPRASPSAAASSSDDARTSADFEALFAWLAQTHGVDCSKVSVGRDDVAGWGLRARKDLGVNECALSVPRAAWVTVDKAKADGEIGAALSDAQYNLASWTTLALYVLKERERGDKAKFAAYAKTLPRTLDAPLFWSAEELAMIAGTQLLDNAAGYDAYIRQVYDDLSQDFFVKYADVFDVNTTFDEASFRWAFGILRSRALPPCEGANIALIPGLDLVNHSSLSSAKWSTMGGIVGAVSGLFGRGGDNATMRVDVDRAVKNGEPIFVNYAPQGIDSQFALDFGFVDAITPSPGYALTLSIPEDDVNCFDKLDVLDVCGLGESPTFTLRAYQDPDPELRTFLRLLNCKGQDAFLLEALFRQTCWQLISEPLSAENEADCCASMTNGVAGALARYETRSLDEEKNALMQTPGSLTTREEIAVRVRLGEKSALIETASFFDVIASRLDKLEYYQERRLRSLNLLDEDGSSTYDPFKETMA